MDKSVRFAVCRRLKARSRSFVNLRFPSKKYRLDFVRFRSFFKCCLCQVYCHKIKKPPSLFSRGQVFYFKNQTNDLRILFWLLSLQKLLTSFLFLWFLLVGGVVFADWFVKLIVAADQVAFASFQFVHLF